MMRLQLALIVVCSAALGGVSADRHGPHYPELYKRTGRPAGATPHTLTFYVKQADNAEASCSSLLTSIATPSSPKFNKLMKFADMKMFSDVNAFKKVLSHLKGMFGTSASFNSAKNMEFIQVRAPISVLENAFGVVFENFQHIEDQHIVARRTASKFVVPKEIHKFVDFVLGSDALPYYRKGQRPIMAASIVKGEKRQASSTTTPQVLWKIYQINATQVSSSATANIYASLGQSFNPSDLQGFQTNYNIPQDPITNIIGYNNASSCSDPDNCIEASLDVQTITATAWQANTTFWSIDQNVEAPFASWATAMANDAQPPLVSSISYGALGPETPHANMRRFNIEACKLGLRGITIVVASGDDGVANFIARGNSSACGFQPSYPAVSPYVLAVGATHGPEVGQTEVACDASEPNGCIITTGGGFSLFFQQPSYQAAAVKQYNSVAVNLPPQDQYNYNGRGYPDVAVLGHSFPVWVNGQDVGPVDGTSASSPAMAAMIVLVNSARIAAGKNPIGFLNVALYTSVDVTQLFHDITHGNNRCTAVADGGQPTCCQYGFTAAAGWDPLTGFGTPHFPAFFKAFVGM